MMKAPLRVWAAAAVVCAVLLPSLALASGFVVDPVRMDLPAGTRSSAVAIRNEDERPLGFEMRLMAWSQDAEGKDRYAETADLIFFPKILTVQPGRSKVIRVGLRAPATSEEKTYRLYIEELPTNIVKSEGPGAHVNVLFRIGAPVFVAPLRAHDGLEIGPPALAGGELKLTVTNTGNRHQEMRDIEVRGVDAGGKETFATKLADRYLLAGVTKPYTVAIPAARCAATAAIEVSVMTDRAAAQQRMHVTQAMCGAK